MFQDTIRYTLMTMLKHLKNCFILLTHEVKTKLQKQHWCGHFSTWITDGSL